MKFDQIKQWACQFLLSVCGFLLVILACAAVQGTLFLPLALVLGLGDLMAMNALCAPRASAASHTGHKPAAAKPVSLRVVQGGRAA